MIGGHIVSEQIMLEGIDSVYSYFPRLGERSNQVAGSLSGGEQQMLAIGRALISRPRILLIDELSLGLMPRIVDECYAVLETLKENNIAILLVEQNTERALSVADQVGVLEAGNMTWSGTAEAARENETLASSMMGAD
jgi:branched-chain amino acid transport system ATP-binding protein